MAKISELPIIQTVTKDEWVECIQQLPSGGFRNYRVKLNSLAGLNGQDGAQGTDGLSAYDLAVQGGFEGTKEQWLESLSGKSAFDIAVELGFDGDVEQWLAGLKGEDGAAGADGRSAYEIAVDHGYEGTESEFAEQLIVGGAGVSGAVFVKNVVPVNSNDNVGERVYSDDGATLISASSTSTLVRVELMAITGHTNYRPNVTVNDLPVTLTARGDAPLFDGSIDIELGSDGLITLVHEDGATWTTTVMLDEPPVITSAVFVGGYPSGQTELKENDVVSIQVEADTEVVAYEIENYGALKASAGSFSEATLTTINNRQVANRGNVATARGFRIRVQKSTGAWSEWFSSAEEGSVDSVNTMVLNNTRPTIAFTGVTYPEGQNAIKNAEQAVVNHSISNFDSVEYSSTQLTVTNPNVYETAKVVSINNATYSINNNFTVTARRNANASVTTSATAVRIASEAPTINVTLPHARLRSGGNNGTQAQLHTVTLTSNQALAQAPSLNVPEGSWHDAQFTANAARTVWTRRLRVHDDDAKGIFSFNSLNAVNDAGIAQNVLNNGGEYTLGGFVFRTLTVPAFPNREASLGTQVSDTAKLRCTNLSKGQSGSLNFSFQGSMDNAVDRYTITGPSGTLNPSGNLWYNLDGANASSNTGGTMQVEIEEVV